LFIVASFLFYRIGWLMHDAAHNAIFVTNRNNRRFAALCAGILGEFPSGWRYGHNRHHASPNVLGHDMDQSERWDPNRRYKNVLTAFVGLVLLTKYKGRYLPKTLLLLGVRDGYFCFHHFRKNFSAELACSLGSMSGQLAFMIWLFGPWGSLLFFANTTIGMIYLNTAFMGNHYDLPSFERKQADDLSFAELQILTARNYTGGTFARYVFGGLEHQIEHHLFPNLPRHSFLRAEPIVRRFCAEHDLPYEVRSFTGSIQRVLRFHIRPASRHGEQVA
jgi:fatty acid desaturase